MNTRDPSLRRRLLWSAELCLQWTGMTGRYSEGRPGSAVILMYHSVSTPENAPFVDPRVRIDVKTFATQMTMLAECRKPIGMSELVGAMGRRKIAPRSVVVTFDDGYLDTLTVAAPVLERLRIPAILYLPTDYIEKRAPQWVDRLHHLFVRRTKHRLVHEGVAYDLRATDIARRLRGKIESELLLASMAAREELLASIEGQLRPYAEQPRLTLGWDEVRKLRQKYPRFEIGIHTAEHTDMTSRPVDELRAELGRAQDTVRGELGTKLWHFSYPYSRDNETSQHLVRTLGYESAVTAGDDIVVRQSSDPMRLLRLEPHDNVAMLPYWTSGAHPELPRVVFGRA